MALSIAAGPAHEPARPGPPARHRAGYGDHAARVGRFLPGVGRLRR